MSNEIKSKLIFIDYKVKEVILRRNDNFESDGSPVDVAFDIKHKTVKKDNDMKIILEVEVFKEAEEKNYPFYIKVILEGNFETEGEDIERFEINGIALLYPYIRAIISTYTANSNIPTLILPPINVANYYKSKKN